MASNNPAASVEAAGEEHVSYDGKDYSIVREGMAEILVPASVKKGKDGKDSKEQQVFYNPIQQFNRDLSVLAIRAYGEDALAKRKAHIAEQRINKEKKRRRPKDEDEASNRPAKVQVSERSSTVTATATTSTSTQAAAAPITATSADVQMQQAGGEEEPPKVEQQGAGGEGQGEGQAEGDKQEQPQNGSQTTTTTTTPRFTILDALSASGLRALRYSHELPFVTSVTANDLTKSATESIRLNAKHNKLEDKIQISHDDAIAHMYRRIADDLSHRDSRGNPSQKNKYDVIDLDPYGTAAPFLDAAVQSVRNNGGLLAVTCTDASHWAGHAYVEKCYSLYGASPIKGLHSHEVGLRIILYSLSTVAARYGLTIEPLLSLSIDFYCRIFVRVRQSPQAVSFLGGKTMVTYQCSGCSAWETQPMVRTRPHPKKKGEGHFYKHGLAHAPTADKKCAHCESTMHLGGPMYAGPIHDPDFIRRILALLPTLDDKVYGTIPRIEGMLTTALEEHIPGPEPREAVDPRDREMARVDHAPFFFLPAQLSGIVRAESPSENTVRGALKHLGYRVTRSHCRPGSIKTDAPWDTIWFVMKEYIRQKAPVKTERIKPEMAAYKLLGLDQGQGQDVKAKKPEAESDVAVPDEGAEKEAQGEDAEQGAAEEGAAGRKKSNEAELRKTLVFNEALVRLGRDNDTKKLVRYQLNPRENWGPLTRATGH